MTFPYLHPVSLACAALVFVAARRLAQESRRDGRYVMDLIGWGRALQMPLLPVVVFWLVSWGTDPGIPGPARLVNMAFAAVTTVPLALVVLFMSDASALAKQERSQAFKRYRPARLRQKAAPGEVPPANGAAVLATAAIMLGVFGVRFGEHLRARTLVPALPADFGVLELRDAAGTMVGEIPSAGTLRPGEGMCTDLKVDLILPDGGVKRLNAAARGDPEGVGTRAHNIIENAWQCDVYAETPARVPVPADLLDRWQATTTDPASLPVPGSEAESGEGEEQER